MADSAMRHNNIGGGVIKTPAFALCSVAAAAAVLSECESESSRNTH